MRFLLLVLAACGARPSGPPFGEQTATLVGDGVSTAGSEIRLAASPDGQLRIWGTTDRPGGPGGWDLWISRKSGATWSPPEPAPFDSPANDFDPAFSADGRYVYFFSNREGGAGGDDIYRVPFDGTRFGAIEHLGPEINTAGNEWAPCPALDGSGLLFATNRVPRQARSLLRAGAGRGVRTGRAPAGRDQHARCRRIRRDLSRRRRARVRALARRR